MTAPSAPTIPDSAIAIVGMAAHLPGAGSVGEYWEMLREGRRAIRRLDEAELAAAGESAARMRAPNYVPYAAPLSGYRDFDPEFFGFSPKEAAILDPQHRHFLETAWEALEDAGHMPERFGGRIGVWAGCGMGSYFYFNLCSNPALVDQVGMFLLRHTGNDKDFLATRVSHILDLKGPSIGVQTACSTSLVAVHMAARALAAGECDMALAGGVTIELPQGRGYLYAEGEILSPDGECHAFDHRAQGTVFGSGAGVVVLRRLKDALADGDHIWAVIRGSAVNNDGAAKAGYLAPSVEGQADCVAAALAAAGVPADTVGYVECHGTGTYLGDPIEIAALTEAFRRTTARTGCTRIGSVKTNIGHLDTAAGVASLIKAALALHHRALPPSLGYEAPNPAIDFARSPFLVNDRLTQWPGGGPRRAGVNSLGVGGTNAHVILEEAPAPAPSEAGLWPAHPLVISARSRAALDAAAAGLAARLRADDGLDLADVAFTLKEGRRAFPWRRVLVAADAAEAASLLEAPDPRRVFTAEAPAEAPEVVFMFPGGGAQHAGMARDLYETEPVFREWMDRGLAHLAPRLDHDLRATWLPAPGQEAAADARLLKPSVQLPLILMVEVALAELWRAWGVQPAALIGHSMGENAAACVAGVMGYEDAIDLVHLRGRLFDGVPPGGMLSVPLPEAEVAALLGDTLDLASVNAPGLCVVSGPDAALAALAARLAARDIETARIAIDIAAHSRMLEPVLADFGAHLARMRLSPPRLPVISNRSGRPLTAAEATDPAYWVGHLRHTVRFADGIAHLREGLARVFLEVGPGRVLASLAQANGVPAARAINALRHPEQPVADDAWHLATLARLWANGVEADWDQVWAGIPRRRLPLPTYPFQRKPYFIEPGTARVAEAAALPAREDDIARWGWRPVWRPEAPRLPAGLDDTLAAGPAETWLLFADGTGIAARAAARLAAAGHRVVTVEAGDAFARTGPDRYRLAPERGREGYDQLLADLIGRGLAPSRIGHFWLVTEAERFRPGSSFFHRNMEQGFWSVLFLAQAIEGEGLPRPVRLAVFTNGAARVGQEALAWPEKTCIEGPARMIGRELPGLSCTTLDLVLPARGRRGAGAEPAALDRLAEAALEELLAAPAEGAAALREGRRFLRDHLPQPLPAAEGPALPAGPVLVTGGFGGIGQALAMDLARRGGARLVLLSRTALPRRENWARHLATHAPYEATARRIRAVQALEAAGAEVLVAAADVCNLEEMRAALAAATARFGPVAAVLHSAGTIDDAPLLARTPLAAEAVLAPKVHGTQVLMELFPDGATGLILLFSSTSTATAPAGQADYVAANAYLDAVAEARAGGRTRVMAINWGIWAEVGMAAEAAARRAGPAPAPAAPAGQPLLATATFDARGHRLFRGRLTTADWVVGEHRLKDGSALLPGTGYLELAAEALAAQGERGPFEVRDLTFLRALRAGDAGIDIAVSLLRSEAGYAFTVASAAEAGGRRGFVRNAEGTLALGPAAPPAVLDLEAIGARCGGPRAADPRGLPAAQEAHLAFGPRWRVLREWVLGTGEGLARLALEPRFRGDIAAGYLLHPALLDIATGWAMALIPGYAPTHLWVPVGYGRVRVYAPLPEEVASHVRAAPGNRAEGPFARFDITLADPAGRVCLVAEGFTLRRLEGALAPAAAPRPSELLLTAEAGPAGPPTAAEARLAAQLAQGIRPEEGARAFAAALASGLTRVAVTPVALPALVREAARPPAAPAEAAPGFDRPELDSDYIAPRSDIERTLAGFWSELLGVARVGVEDDFFALGGHSLIAVRLFTMIRRSYAVEFPISVLFEAPTIAACARLIAGRIGDGGTAEAGGDGTAPAAAPPARRFTHLVAMHEGEGGPRTPFFLVAGMFGNVLNLRHLAALVGRDRPFYGLQARGLMGGEAPHATFEAAAADMIAEIRQVQPHGPYLLGGFSGGGLTAWEIARQIEAGGETAALVVLLDTPLPLRPVLTRRDRALVKLAELRARGPAYLLDWARARLQWEIARRGAPAADPGEGQGFHNAAIEAAFRAALPGYRLQPRAGATVLFRPPLDRRWKVGGGRHVSGAREYVAADNGWTPFAPGLEVVEVPGDHDSMVLEPNVRVLAARLRAAIAAAEASPAPAAADAPDAGWAQAAE